MFVNATNLSTPTGPVYITGSAFGWQEILVLEERGNLEQSSNLVHRLAPMYCGDLSWVDRILTLPV
jgi:hypothetical protein